MEVAKELFTETAEERYVMQEDTALGTEQDMGVESMQFQNKAKQLQKGATKEDTRHPPVVQPKESSPPQVVQTAVRACASNRKALDLDESSDGADGDFGIGTRCSDAKSRRGADAISASDKEAAPAADKGGIRRLANAARQSKRAQESSDSSDSDVDDPMPESGSYEQLLWFRRFKAACWPGEFSSDLLLDSLEEKYRGREGGDL